MNPHKYRHFRTYLVNIGKQSYLATGKVEAIIKNHFIEIEAYSTSLSELVRVTRGEDGEVEVATSLKIPNLRFHIWELFYRLVEKSISIIDAEGEPYRTAFFIVGFLKDVFELVKFPLAQQDAEILVGIYILGKRIQNRTITVDLLNEFFQAKYTDNQITNSLTDLEKIACISLSDNQIEIIEKIVIINA